MGRNNKTAPYVKRLSNLIIITNDERTKEAIHTALSKSYLYNGNYNKAIRIIFPLIPQKVKRYTDQPTYTNRIQLGNSYANLGNMYLQIVQYVKETNSLNDALPLLHDYIGATVRVQNSLIETYLRRELIDSALICYNKVYLANSNLNKFYE